MKDSSFREVPSPGEEAKRGGHRKVNEAWSRGRGGENLGEVKLHERIGLQAKGKTGVWRYGAAGC
jgi:hypothetical protein